MATTETEADTGTAGSAPDRDEKALDGRLKDWQDRLLDLSYRNPLIRYTARRGLEIHAPSAHQILGLPEHRRTAQFLFEYPDDDDDGNSDASAVTDSGLDESAMRTVGPDQPLNVDFAESYDDDVVLGTARRVRLSTNATTEQELNKTLRSLYRRSKSDYDEKAIRVLYLAVGFLDWRDETKREDLSSPLVMVPVELVRHSIQEPFALKFIEGEDVVINPTLKTKIEREHGLRLPDDWEWEGKSLSEELDDIRNAVSDTEWTVTERVALSIFSFQKMVMYRDLVENAEQIKSHPAVRSLGFGRRSTDDYTAAKNLPGTDQLDRHVAPAQSHSILDADSSQQHCIEAARNGVSLVMQGPPGTGKSQTIANIIAESIGAGRSVLFVSEKIAALEVVYKRLERAGLGSLCLNLHGEKAKRHEVVSELAGSCIQAGAPDGQMSEAEADQLTNRRAHLNKVAERLHTPDDRLHGFTPYTALGYLAENQPVPVVETPPQPKFEPPEEARSNYEEMTRQFRAAAQLWDLALQANHPWRDLIDPDPGSAVVRGIADKVETLTSAAADLREAAAAVAAELDHPEPPTMSDVETWIRVGRLLEEKPRMTTEAISASYANALKPAIDEAHAVFDGLADMEKAHRSVYAIRKPGTFIGDVEAKLKDALASLEAAIGRSPSWEDELSGSIPALAQVAEAFDARRIELESDLAAIRSELGQPENETTLAHATELASLARLANLPDDRPDRSWMNHFALTRAENAIERLEPRFNEYNNLLKEVLEDYDQAVFTLPVAEMKATVVRSKSQLFGRFRKSYRELREDLSLYRKDELRPKHPEQDIEKLVRTWRLHSELLESKTDLECLGEWNAGVATDIEGAGRARARAAEILKLSDPRADREALANAVCRKSEPKSELLDASDRIFATRESVEPGVQALTTLASDRRLSNPSGMPLDEMASLLGELRPVLVGLDAVVADLSNGMDNPEPKLSTLIEAAHRIDAINRSHTEIEAATARWRKLFGAIYKGESTDWNALSSAAQWLEKLIAMIPTEPGHGLRRLIVSDSAEGWQSAFRDLETAAATCHRAAVPVRELFLEDRASKLAELFEAGRVDEIERLGHRMHDRISDLPKLADLRRIREALSTMGWGDYLTAAIAEGLDAGDVEQSAKHAYWEVLLEKTLDDDPDLGRFRGQTHADMIEEFRNLDEQAIRSGAARAMAKALEKRNDGLDAHPAECDLLIAESKKKRHRRSVKKILAETGSLLPHIKPCLMMSPMTVSQFLGPDHQFDLVVFDEASQVPPWDAVNCIYRSRQLIVSGDSNQLPPTAFFTTQDLDEAEAAASGSEEGMHQESMESILDACETILPTSRLRWHYRSRHEDLIAYSNRHFYDNDLITFPSPERDSDRLGVEFVYVDDGVYDRGRSQTNRVEARRVAERVIELLESDPERTLGVVTLNSNQRDAVEDAIEEQRRERPDLDLLFSGDRMEGLFVKNLESVQGDERDQIIFSIGYGRDEYGKFTMNFGPIGHDGGERRLNVAITRARQRVEVFSSVRPEEFRIGPGASAGTRHLRDYMEYAARGREALGTEVELTGGDFESPFERAVAEAIRGAGYEVVPQVGAAGFRIDLGIIDPNAPSRFLLGVECDGATYHGSPTARDRDRLRQSVLEDLGWNIHRIWSRDWVKNPEAELDDTLAAIEDVPKPPEQVSA